MARRPRASGASQVVAALCLAVVLAQSILCLSTAATTSLPAHSLGGDGPSAPFQLQQQPHPTSASGEGATELQQQQLALQLALVSARGPLAFWRPALDAGELTGSGQAQQHSSRPVSSSQLINNHSKCPQLSGGKTSASSAELLAVEGSNLKLNFVVVGSLRMPAPPPNARQQPQQQQQQQLAGAKLSFRWTKNGQPLLVVSSSSLQQQPQQPHQHHQQQQHRPRSGGHHFQRHQFGELIINENDIIRRYFANLPASSMMAADGANSSAATDRLAAGGGGGGDDDDEQPFVLAPHFDERQIGRLKLLDSQLDSLLRPLRRETNIRWPAHRAAAQSQQDDFLADAQLIDWARLETYLRQEAGPLRLYLPATAPAPATPPPDCPALAPLIEQLTIVQLDTPTRLQASDAGLYQLEACTARACQSVSFRLHIAPDWPHLERTFEHQILEPGDRLSIKCEATGFTLPQITWFLDGQQLNEHKSAAPFGETANIIRTTSTTTTTGDANDEDDEQQRQQQQQQLMMATMTAATNLRVGDYVSQDNHVHSFVNASRLQLTDGGLYRCQANNGFHLVEHEARIDVRGPATFARQLANQSLLLSVDSQLRVQCPFSGYPIASIEWFFKPSPMAKHQEAGAGAGGQLSALDSSDDLAIEEYSPAQRNGRSLSAGSGGVGGGRAKRLSPKSWPQVQPATGQMPAADSREADGSNLDEDREPDPRGDEWLSQAGAATPPPDPPNLDDYPSDYLLPAGASVELPEAGIYASASDFLDYGDLQMDMQQQQQQSALDRRRRDAPGGANDWVKLPQSRRHQVHPNGTLIVQDLSRNDQGSYKCRVGSKPASSDSVSGGGGRLISSNEFHLSILVPPVISPFSSAESLREGMRNFLTCSVIEGDSPIQLSWLKDNQPIEDYMERSSLSSWPENQDHRLGLPGSSDPLSFEGQRGRQAAGQQEQRRIKVETSNEYTSTLYFSHVDFRDSGNYTCMATNKAASVNYTARMLVNVPPKWLKVPKDLELTAGQNMVIDCQATAYPSARVWWEIGISDGQQQQIANNQTRGQASAGLAGAAKGSISATNSPAAANHPPLHYRTIISNSRIHILENASLVIRDLQPSDQGYYLCQANNNFGSLSALIKLTVNVGASFTSKYLLKYAKLGERVELSCEPNGQAPIEIGWFWRGHHQAAGARSSPAAEPNTTSLFVGLLGGGAGDQSAGHSPAAQAAKISFEVGQQQQPASVRLIVAAASRRHSAEFICRASNRFGADERLIKLLVQEPPEQVRDLQPVQVESRSVSLSWPAPYNGNSPITGYTVEWAPVQQQQQQQQQQPSRKAAHHLQVQQPAATLTGLLPQTSYEIRVRAHNQLGQSREESPEESGQTALLVTTAEEAPNVPPADIRAQPLSSSSVQLSWLAPNQAAGGGGSSEAAKQPSIKGYYLGYRLANSSSGSTDSYVFKTVPLEPSSLMPVSVPAADQPLAGQWPNASSGQQPQPQPQQQQQQQRLKVVIDDLKRATKYSVIVYAFNSAGSGPQSDPIETRTLLDDPPAQPVLRVGSLTFSSIELQWSFAPAAGHNYQQQQLYHRRQYFSPDGQARPKSQNQTIEEGANDDERDRDDGGGSEPPIDGYLLYYRPTATVGGGQAAAPAGAWLERKLRPETHTMLSVGPSSSADHKIIVPLAAAGADPQPGDQPAGPQRQLGWQRTAGLASTIRFTLDQLACGNSYQIYLVAYNSIGSGQPSASVRTKTRGSAPIAPRKQDFLVANSTLAMLNLDSWADGGCSISNFEVRYRQREPGSAQSRAHPSSQAQAHGPEGRQQEQQQQQPWLLVASQISGEQRQLELRDLKPESWYSVWVLAESAAGKSEAQFTFMTLDKFGRLPLEALEMSSASTGGLQTNGGGLLTRYGDNSLVRSLLLYNFSSPNNASPLLMGACLALLLFATCSLLLIRRYNRTNQFGRAANTDHRRQQQQQQQHKDTGSIDSGGRPFGHHHYRQQQQQPQPAQVGPASSLQAAQVIGAGHELAYAQTRPSPMMTMLEASISDYGCLQASGLQAAGDSNNNNNNNPSVSPCKTSTTILTGSSRSDNSSQGLSSVCGAGLTSFRSAQQPAAQMDLSRFMGDVAAAAAAATAATTNSHHQQAPFSSATLAHHFGAQQQQQPFDEVEAPPDEPPLKLGALVGAELGGQRFKTMPHPRAGCNAGAQYAAYCQADDQFSQQQQQQIKAEQQQIYSKLRLLQYNNSNNNNNNTYCQQLGGQQPVYDANTINLAVLSQAQQHLGHQKLLSSSNACTLGRRQPHQANATANNHINMNCAAVGSCHVAAAADQPPTFGAGQQSLGSEALLADSYAQQQYVASAAGAPAAEPGAIGNGYGPAAYGQVGGASSIVSGSDSSTNTAPSSAAAGKLAHPDDARTQEQLISLTNEVNAIGNQCSKSANSAKIAGCLTANHLHQQQPLLLANHNSNNSSNNNNTNGSNTNNSNNLPNEQMNNSGDYALPFPPKWV